jgi:hypothetical protein
MKTLGVTFFFLYISICLSVSLYAQESSVEDTVVPYRMSREKADSLLISLSKGKSKKTEFTSPEISEEANSSFGQTDFSSRQVGVSSGQADPSFEQTDSISAQDTMAIQEGALITDFSLAADSLIEMVTESDFPVADTLHTEGAVVESSDRSRKKVKIARSELLIKQAGGGIRLKNEDGDYVDLRSVNEGTVWGIGGYKMKDDYLSPEKYGGVGLRFMNERMRLTKLADYTISRQNIVNVDISSAINGAENANFLSALVDYSLGYHYRFLPDPYFKIMIGGSARGMFGMVYNTRNGNNPMTLHADVDLNFSLIAIHEFRVKKHSLAIRYQFETPFAGVLFCPVYGQSYYEIFTLGNTAEVLNFSSFHNKFAMRNYLTFDFPVGSATCRVGYFGSYYTTDVHEIDRYIISHNVMIGFVKEFVPFGGRDMKKRNLFRSAYY